MSHPPRSYDAKFPGIHRSEFHMEYIREAETYDKSMLEAWDKSIDTLLIFAALFSAVVTAFIIESYKLLQPDYAELTFRAIVRAATNTSLPDPDAFKPPSGAQILNCLWIASVILSLLTAIVGILAKQWIVEYPVHHANSAEEKVLLRAFRYRSVQRWHVPTIIAALPVPLHASLLLFLAGLSVFFSQIDRFTSYVAIACSCAVLVAYSYFTLHPVLVPSSPYRSLLALSLRRRVAALRGRASRDPWFTQASAADSAHSLAVALCSLVSSVPLPSLLEEIVTALAESLQTWELRPFLTGPLRSALMFPLDSTVRLEVSLGAIVRTIFKIRLSQLSDMEDPYPHVLLALLALRANRSERPTLIGNPADARSVDAAYSSAIQRPIGDVAAYPIMAIMRAAFDRNVFSRADWRIRLKRCLTLFHAWRRPLSSMHNRREAVRLITAALRPGIRQTVPDTMRDEDSPAQILASLLTHGDLELRAVTCEQSIVTTTIEDILWSYAYSQRRGDLLAIADVIAHVDLAQRYAWSEDDIVLIFPASLEFLDFYDSRPTASMLVNIVHPSLPWMLSAVGQAVSRGLSAWSSAFSLILTNVLHVGGSHMPDILGPLFGDATLGLLAGQPSSVCHMALVLRCIQRLLSIDRSKWTAQEELILNNFVACELRDSNGSVLRRWNFFQYARDVVAASSQQHGSVVQVNLVIAVRRAIFTSTWLKNLVVDSDDVDQVEEATGRLSDLAFDDIRTLHDAASAARSCDQSAATGAGAWAGE